MARKNLIYSYELFSPDTPITATSVSNATSVAQLDYSSIYLTWESSDLTATVEMLARNGDNSEFYELDFGAPIPISGASGSHQIILSEMPFTELKMQITVTAGTSADVSAVITAKSEGA